MEAINSLEAPAAVGPYSHAIRTGDFLFCSGQIPLDPTTGEIIEGGIEMETRQVFKNIRAVLATAGTTLDKVAKTTIFLTDMADFPAVNGIYGGEFGDHKPARSTVAVAALPLGAAVEIECVVDLSE
ncbi:MAG: RidA family protein [Verrucomicrobiales bacterium]|nr:RidA family protein [Verrucomicrobiales bacterium]